MPSSETAVPPPPSRETVSPDRAVALFNKAQERLRDGDDKGAEALLKRAVAAAPDLFPAQMALGALYERKGRRAEAEASYREALARKPDLIEGYISLGRLAEERNDTERALFHYEKAIELDPERFVPHYRLGLIRRRRRQLNLSIHHMRIALRLRPANRAARYWLWLSVADKGGMDAWEVELGRSLVEAGEETPMMYYRGEAARHYAAGRIEKAIETIQKAVKVNPRWRDPRWRRILEDYERYRRAKRGKGVRHP